MNIYRDGKVSGITYAIYNYTRHPTNEDIIVLVSKGPFSSNVFQTKLIFTIMDVES
jgi:hypothetical protein